MANKEIKNLIFVDCEGHGPAPTLNDPAAFEFGAVAYPSRQTFHGVGATKETFENFDNWILSATEKGFRPLFVSDNPAYDWQFINYYFHLFLGKNPFGHSARRIGDFYAGLVGDFTNASSWKKLRVTPHDHNPVNDAMGNLEAFERLLNAKKRKMRKKRNPKFKVEVVYKETPDAEDRLRQLWDLLLSLPDSGKNEADNKKA